MTTSRTDVPEGTANAGLPFAQGRSQTRAFALEPGHDDPLLREILDEDMRGRAHPLELLRHWSEELGRAGSHGRIGRKLDALFRAGRTPRRLSGFHDGITLGMKTGLDAFSTLCRWMDRLGLPPVPDPLQIVFGRLVADINPWAGKVFEPLTSDELARRTGRESSATDALLGSNRFRRVRGNLTNRLSFFGLPLLVPVEQIPNRPPKAQSWLEAKGGAFVARVDTCVDPAFAGKEVLDLNYRWPRLGNRTVANLLRDQVVEVADGLYLGILFYATRHIFRPFDPKVPDAAYRYRNFGYFLLLDDSWRKEKDRLFPELATA